MISNKYPPASFVVDSMLRKFGLFWLVALGCLTCHAFQDAHFQDSSAGGETDDPRVIPIVIEVEIPRIPVREYHRPYVSVWIEDSQRKLVQHLAVWYQQDKNEEGHGEKWLPDLRQWWRRGGRELGMPIDGISGATRAIGKHKIRVSAEQLATIEPGSYSLVVEAAREVGGRELVRLPFTWPVSQPKQTKISGKSELGAVTINISPSENKNN